MREDNPAPPGVDPQRFLDLSGGLLVVADFDGEIRWLTATFALILGFDRDELIGSWFGDFVHPDDAEKVAERWERVLAGEDAVRFEYRARTSDGSYRSMLWSAIGVPEEGQVYAAARDVTDLREAEGLYASAVANARLAMLIASVEPASLGRLTAANPAASRFTGFSEEELLGRDFQSLMHPDDLESILIELGRLLDGERESFELEKRYLRSDGGVAWGRMHVSLIRDPGGTPLYAVGQIQDISDRKRAEEEAAAAERRFERIFADAPIGMAFQDADGRYLQVNRALCELLGRSADELLEMRFQELVHPDDLARDEELRGSLLRGEAKVGHHEKRLRRADGSWLEGAVAISCLTSADEGKRFVVQLQDVTDRKQVERVVRRSRERLQAITDGMPSGVYVKDLEGRFEMVNTYLAAAEGLRPQDVVGRLDREIYAEEDVARLRALEARALESDRPVTFEETISRDDGTHTFVVHAFALRDSAGEPYAIAGTGTDITDRVRADEERRRLEASAQETERLETVGRLAGGVAHDFNNLLSVILNNAALAADALPEHSSARADLDEIRVAAERAADLTHQLVQFSRQEMAEPRVLDPNAVVERARRLLERTLGEDVELRTRIGEGIPAIEIDPGQLERILLNLAVNARDAMADGGRLDIVTERVEVAGGAHAQLSVLDSGHGMSPEVAARAFEPFFTTKPSGEGTGLGLATVHGIVMQAGGTVELEPRGEGGTRVTMRFPAAAKAPAEDDGPDERQHVGRGETLLVVEDEESVRRLAGRLLRDGGYEVIEAGGFGQALAAIDGSAVDLLLTDVVMPGMSGRELAERVRASHPETAVLFMSGYTDDVVVRHGVAGDGLSFLPKPFTRDTLLHAVARALSRDEA